MAPDELKFVRKEARIHEQQLIMAELGQAWTHNGSEQHAGAAVSHKEAIANLELEQAADPTMAAMLSGYSSSCSELIDTQVKPIVQANHQYQKYGACEPTKKVVDANDDKTDSNNNHLGESKRWLENVELGDSWKSATIGGNKLVEEREKAGLPPLDGDHSSFMSNKALAEKMNKNKNKRQSLDSESQNSGDTGQQRDPCLIQRLAKVIPCFGILLSLCASVFLGTAGMLVKLIESVHGIEVAVSRALIQLIIYATIISFRQNKWLPERKELLPVAMRAVFGGVSITFSYCCLKLIPLGDATTIRFSLPIWTLIMSYFLLNESCTLYKIAAVFISISGVILVTKPDDCIYIVQWLLRVMFNYETPTRYDAMPTMFLAGDDEPPANDGAAIRDIEEIAMLVEAPPPLRHIAEGRLTAHQNDSIHLEDTNRYYQPQQQQQFGMVASSHNYTLAATQTSNTTDMVQLVGATAEPMRQVEGCLMALASSICLALSIIALRMCKQTPSEVTIFWLSVTSVAVGSASLLALDEWSVPTNLLDCCLILLNGLCGSLGQWFVTNSLKVEQSGLIALARTFDIEVAFLYSALLLGEQIRITSIIGSILVTLGVVIVLVPRWLPCCCYEPPTDHDDDRHDNDRTTRTGGARDEATSTTSGASSGPTDDDDDDDEDDGRHDLSSRATVTTILTGQPADARASGSEQEHSSEHLSKSLAAHSKL